MREHRFDFLTLIQLLAVLAVAISLAPAGSHLASLISKMQLSPEQYMVAQRAYDGWALFGIPILAALVLTLWHGYLARHDMTALLLSLASFLCLVGTQVIFWTYTYPTNAATQNWTVTPANFDTARAQWEYAHAVTALLMLASLTAIVLATLTAARGRIAGPRG